MSDITNKIIIAVAGEDLIVNYDDYGLSFDSDEVIPSPFCWSFLNVIKCIGDY